MININMNEENKVAVELAGTMAQLMSDLTHIIRGIMHGIADSYDSEDKKTGATEMFKKLFLEGVVSGIFLESNAEQMKAMIKDANRIHNIHEQLGNIHEKLDKINVGVMSLDDLVSVLKRVVDDDDDKPEEKPEETPIIDMEERLAKAINESKPDQPEEPEKPEEEENHEAE